MAKAHALLRAGFPYVKTLGMRRFTSYPVDLAIGGEGRLYVLSCGDLGNSYREIRVISWDEDDLGTFGGPGTDDGKFTWPVGLALDRDENIYVSDAALTRITILDRQGNFLGKWGEQGAGTGQLDHPSCMAFDADENLYVVDAMNHRVQKFTKDGRFLLVFGEYGTGDGQFNMPWGIAIDDDGDLYVTDWRNDRVQKFSSDGRFIFAFGGPGNEKGRFDRPTGIAVDRDGDIYVADWRNNRVQQFDPTRRYVGRFLGDATLSPRARNYIMASSLPLRQREMVDLEPQKRFRAPIAVRVDGEGQLYVADCGSNRIQIYQKDAYRLTPEQILEPLRSPLLNTA
jgi:DNA-binding beta-propeller fold protein YncE